MRRISRCVLEKLTPLRFSLGRLSFRLVCPSRYPPVRDTPGIACERSLDEIDNTGQEVNTPCEYALNSTFGKTPRFGESRTYRCRYRFQNCASASAHICGSCSGWRDRLRKNTRRSIGIPRNTLRSEAGGGPPGLPAGGIAGGRCTAHMLPPPSISCGYCIEPGAVVCVQDHVGRDDNPLVGVVRCGLLAVPKSRLRHGDGGVGEAVGIEVKDLQSALVGEIPDLGQRLIPIDIGIARPPVHRMAPG